MQKVFRKVSKTECIELRADNGALLSRGYVRLREGKPTQIFRLKTPKEHRRKGYATIIMQEIIENYGNREITLLPNASPEDGMTIEELRDWYHRFDFVDQSNKKTMIRRITLKE